MAMKYQVTVVRKQKWTYIIESDDEDDAKTEAEEMAADETPHDDWAYSTEATRF